MAMDGFKAAYFQDINKYSKLSQATENTMAYHFWPKDLKLNTSAI